MTDQPQPEPAGGLADLAGVVRGALEAAGHAPYGPGRDGWDVRIPRFPAPPHVLVRHVRAGPLASLPATTSRRPLAAYEAALRAAGLGVAWWEEDDWPAGLIAAPRQETAGKALLAVAVRTEITLLLPGPIGEYLRVVWDGGPSTGTPAARDATDGDLPCDGPTLRRVASKLARAALKPGGVTAAGMHFCVDHATCRQLAAGSAGTSVIPDTRTPDDSGAAL